MLNNQQLKTFGGFLINSCAFALTTTLHPADQLATGGILTGLAAAIASNTSAKFFEGFGSYSNLVKRLSKEHPNNVNHDLERLIKEASLVALDYISIFFEESLEQDFNYFENFDNKQITVFFNQLRAFFNQARKDLKYYLTDESLEKTIIDSPEDYLKKLADYFILVSRYPLDEATKDRFKIFFKEYMPYCFQLAFKETLKSDDKGFKAFQIWVLEDLKDNNQQFKSSLTNIENGINQVLNGRNLINDTMIENVTKGLTSSLETKFGDLGTQLERLNKDVKQSFEQWYSISARIIDKVVNVELRIDKLYDISYRTEQKLNHLIQQQSDKNENAKTQVIFSKSTEIQSLVNELSYLPLEISANKDNYEKWKETYDANPNPKALENVEEYFTIWTSSVKRLEELNYQLDCQKVVVMSNYELLFKGNNSENVTSFDLYVQNLFTAGDFTTLENVLCSPQRNQERITLQKRMFANREKESFAKNDLLAAQTILRKGYDIKKDNLRNPDFYFQQSIKMYPGFNNHRAYGLYLLDIDPNKSLRQFELALTFTDKKSIDYGRTLANIGNAYSQILNYTEAIKKCEESVQFFRIFLNDNCDSSVNLAMALNNLALLYVLSSKDIIAENIYLEALGLLNKSSSDNPKLFGILQQNLALLLNKLGRHEEAEHYYLTSIDWAKKSFDLGLISKAEVILFQSNIGSFYSDQIRIDDAENFFFDGIKLYEKKSVSSTARDVHSYIMLLTNMGQLYEEKKEFALAEEVYKEGLLLTQGFLKQGLKIYEELDTKIQLSLALLYRTLNDDINQLTY